MTPEESKKKIEELERRIQELENYVNQKKVNQLTYPLDQVSKDIIANL